MPALSRHPLRRLLLFLLAVVLLLVIVFVALARNLTGVVLSLAQAQARSMAIRALNEAAHELLAAGVTYDQLMTVSTDAQGQIRLIQANTPQMNLLAARASLSAQNKISHLEEKAISVPLGSALGVALWAGAGPRIQVRILPVGTVTAGFTTEFQSAGINQTRHKISLTLTAHVSLVMPTGSTRVEAVVQVAMAESIIVGEVPETFTDVSGHMDLLDLVP